MLSKDEIEQFRADLLQWFDSYQRDLPWRRTRDPYAIWLSEVMLQQTRVTAVIPYYERFLKRFPTVDALAQSSEQDLLSHWAGLGYYRRARNVQRAAQAIAEAGSFPADYSGLRALPGIGDYTAAAVASIAFDLPHAAVDGNVLRVLSRVWNDDTDIASAAGRKRFTALADTMLDGSRPGAYNQALMELGAVICSPKAPQCLVCPVAAHCGARKNGRTAELPVKAAAKQSVVQQRTLYWIERDGCLLVWQREADSSLMPGFWELPEEAQLGAVAGGQTLGKFKHGITIYDFRFEVVRAAEPAELGYCGWRSLDELRSAAISTIFRKAIKVVQNQEAGLRVTKVSAGG